MGHRHLARGLLLLGLILALMSGCEAPRTYPVTPSYYYVVPTTTYLRSCASYADECYIVTQVFSGDRVTVLDRNDYNWARVQLDRSGVVGWIPGDLITPSPVPSSFYVAWSNVYMRDCADYNCRSLELLYRGDRVEKIDQDYRGWWRVRSIKSGVIGWIPASATAASPGPPYFYVAIQGLNLRAGPSTGSRVLTTLNLTDRVEMLGANAAGWSQIRDLRTNIIGWVASRYLESFPVSHPKAAPSAPRKPKTPSKEKEPEPQEKPAAPKAM
jgi:uncharacterized protein YgiM (DUF1202 family)